VGDDASDEVRSLLERGPQLGIFRLVAHAEGVFLPWLKYGRALLRDLELDPRLRELAILRVAAVTPGAGYEWTQHVSIAHDVGVTEQQIEAVRNGTDLPGADAHVLRLVDQLVAAASPDRETLTAVREILSTREIVELILVVGQYMALARLTATAGLEADPPAGLAPLVRGR
jgi:4-carboxymuconolactone decarboxylase